MKNLPVTSPQTLTEIAFKASANVKSDPKIDSKEKNTASNSDASVVLLPQNKQKASSEQSVESALSSFLKGVSEEEARLAHGNLDPSRVMDLLSGLED